MAKPLNAKSLGGRVRSASQSLINTNPQQSMWQATGTVIAQAPNLTELRVAELSEGIEFNSKGYTAHTALRKPDGVLIPIRTATSLKNQEESGASVISEAQGRNITHRRRWRPLAEKYSDEPRVPWGPTIVNGLKAFWKFFRTPSGFCIIIYFLNIVVCVPKSKTAETGSDKTLGMGSKFRLCFSSFFSRQRRL